MFYRNPESAALIAFNTIKSQLNKERTKNMPKLSQSVGMLMS